MSSVHLVNIRAGSVPKYVGWEAANVRLLQFRVSEKRCVLVHPKSNRYTKKK